MGFNDGQVVSVALALAALILAWALSRKRTGRFSQYPLPPGPKGIPLVGNLWDMPKEKEWITFAEWGKQYGTHDTLFLSDTQLLMTLLLGDIVYIENFGISMVFLNSYEAVSDLLIKRSAIYSSRPRNVMSIDL